MMSIRQMMQDDFEEILEMMKIFYASPAVLHKTPEEVLRRDIEDCIGDMPFIEGFVFTNDMEICGYAMAAKGYSTEYGGLCVWIEDLYIKPEYRHQGLSTQFFTFLEKLYKNQAVRFRLEVAEDNKSAVDAYLKNGYRLLPYLEMTKETVSCEKNF